jgi:hypothetical protein
MPTNFPTSVDNFTNPTANDSLNLPSHSTQHANANDAIEAVEGYTLQGLNVAQFLHIRDEKTAGTNGGTFTGGAWRTRDLNTVKTNTITGSSLTSNQFVLPAGTYWLEASAPVASGNGNTIDQVKAKIRNITDSTDTIIGFSENLYMFAANTYGGLRCFVSGSFTLTATKTFELQHYARVTGTAGNSFGVATGFSVVEVYSEVKVWKVGL